MKLSKKLSNKFLIYGGSILIFIIMIYVLNKYLTNEYFYAKPVAKPAAKTAAKTVAKPAAAKPTAIGILPKNGNCPAGYRISDGLCYKYSRKDTGSNPIMLKFADFTTLLNKVGPSIIPNITFSTNNLAKYIANLQILFNRNKNNNTITGRINYYPFCNTFITYNSNNSINDNIFNYDPKIVYNYNSAPNYVYRLNNNGNSSNKCSVTLMKDINNCGLNINISKIGDIIPYMGLILNQLVHDSYNINSLFKDNSANMSALTKYINLHPEDLQYFCEYQNITPDGIQNNIIYISNSFTNRLNDSSTNKAIFDIITPFLPYPPIMFVNVNINGANKRSKELKKLYDDFYNYIWDTYQKAFTSNYTKYGILPNLNTSNKYNPSETIETKPEPIDFLNGYFVPNFGNLMDAFNGTGYKKVENKDIQIMEFTNNRENTNSFIFTIVYAYNNFKLPDSLIDIIKYLGLLKELQYFYFYVQLSLKTLVLTLDNSKTTQAYSIGNGIWRTNKRNIAIDSDDRRFCLNKKQNIDPKCYDMANGYNPNVALSESCKTALNTPLNNKCSNENSIEYNASDASCSCNGLQFGKLCYANADCLSQFCFKSKGSNMGRCLDPHIDFLKNDITRFNKECSSDSNCITATGPNTKYLTGKCISNRCFPIADGNGDCPKNTASFDEKGNLKKITETLFNDNDLELILTENYQRNSRTNTCGLEVKAACESDDMCASGKCINKLCHYGGTCGRKETESYYDNTQNDKGEKLSLIGWDVHSRNSKCCVPHRSGTLKEGAPRCNMYQGQLNDPCIFDTDYAKHDYTESCASGLKCYQGTNDFGFCGWYAR